MPHAEHFLCVNKRHLQDESLSVNDALVLSVILHWQGIRGYCWATNEQIAEVLRLSVGTVGKSIRLLQSKDIIKIGKGPTGRVIIPYKDVDSQGKIIRSGGFVLVPFPVFYQPELTAFDALVFCEVVSKSKQGFCYARNRILAEKLGMSESKIEHALKVLERAGYIRRESEKWNATKRKKRRIYILKQPEEFVEEAMRLEAA